MVQALALHESQVLGLWRRAGEAEVSLLALPSLGQREDSSKGNLSLDITLGEGHADDVIPPGANR